MEKVNLKQAEALIEFYFKAKLPVMLWSSPGIGKSSMIHQIGNASNRKVIDCRLSQLEFSDIRGIPFKNDITNEVNWSVPNFLPKDKNDNSILFLDEMNLAHPSIMSAAYQLILDRKIGDYTLPESVSVIAAGNSLEDSSNVNEIPFPLLNRFAHIKIEQHFQTWEKFAKENIHPIIIEYLDRNKQDLMSKSYEGVEYAFNTPRTWEYVSKIITNNAIVLEDLNDKSKEFKVLKHLVSGCVGDVVATKFLQFLKNTFKNNKIDIKKIFSDDNYVLQNKIFLDPNDLESIKVYLDANKDSLLKKSNEIDNSLLFVYNNSSPELFINYNRYLVKTHNMQFIEEFYPKHSKILKQISSDPNNEELLKSL